MAEAVHDAKRLKELQALPLYRKIQISQARIIEWYQRFNGNVYVSFSGGKDSTVLLHMVRSLFPDVPAVFVNTGLEYPDLQKLVRETPNVTIVRPKINFSEVLTTYGYPLISKEVSEAIYYARRIRSQSVQVEREREQASSSLNEENSTESEPTTPELELWGGRSAQNLTARKIPESVGGGRQKPDGGETTSTDCGRHTEHKRLDLMGTRTMERFRTGQAGGAEQKAENERKMDCGFQTGESQTVGPHRKTARLFLERWHDYEPGTRHRREVMGFGRRQAGVNEATPEGGFFSPEDDKKFGAKSPFNKEKWLPLCRDIPVRISHYCCNKQKKAPAHEYQAKTKLVPFLGTLAEESRIRQQAWLRHGCNAFDSKKPTSQPLSFWTEQDILHYLVEYGLQIPAVYGEIVAVGKDGEQYPTSSIMCDGCKLKTTGVDRTGCIYCGFGFHRDKGETRFQRLAKSHPRLYEYALGGGQWVDNPDYDPAAPEYDGGWKNWNPKQIWVPSKEGLGLRTVFDMVNEIYGKEFYRYE